MAHPKSDAAHLSFSKQIIAGGGAGLIEILCMYPLDLAKTRNQLEKGRGKYSSIASTFSTIVREEGFTTLYRGIISPIFAEAPKRAIKFSTNEQYKKLFTNDLGKISTSGSFAAGALAGITEAFVNCPFEVVKVRMQDVKAKTMYNSTFDALFKILRTEGPFVLYRGFEAQMTRNAIWNGTYFATIPFVNTYLLRKPQSKNEELWNKFLSGFIGGTLGTTLNTPWDVAKSRFQGSHGKEAKIPWSFMAIAQIAKEEGPKALWKGYVPRLLRLGPGGGIMILAFDLISSFLK